MRRAVLKGWMTGLCAGWLFLAGPVAALTLDLPGEILTEEHRSVSPGSYALPIGPYDGNAVPSRQVEGAVDQRAFQLQAQGMTTLAILQPLRDQLLAAGFTLVFECEARLCGGYDFRYGIEVIPEPDMHVDMSDFRFVSAEKAGETVSLLVSRSAFAGYVQITRVSPTGRPSPAATVPVDLDAAPARPAPDPVLPGNSDLVAELDAAGRAVLDDLVFASGSAALADGSYPSLAAVAAWLAANPAATIAVVGHTDASGSLAANIALSERRAETVAQVLIDRLGVDRSRIVAEGVGFLAPRATNQTVDGRQKNRRVEVVVTSTQ